MAFSNTASSQNYFFRGLSVSFFGCFLAVGRIVAFPGGGFHTHTHTHRLANGSETEVECWTWGMRDLLYLMLWPNPG